MKPVSFNRQSLIIAALVSLSNLHAETAVLSSIDRILGEREAGGAEMGYYIDSASGLVGVTGAGGSRTDSNLVLGFTLPTLAVGQTVDSVLISFEVAAARNQSPTIFPNLHVYLLETGNPDGSGTESFYHGPESSTATVPFVGTTRTAVSGAVQVDYDDDSEDQILILTGDALALFQSFCGGDHLPDQAEAFFRFNLDSDPDQTIANSLIRYLIDVEPGESSVAINDLPTPVITYLDAVEGELGNTFATGGSLSDITWESGADSLSPNETLWTKRTLVGGNADTIFQAMHEVVTSDDMPELTTQITGLANGNYTIWAFYWDQVVSGSQNWCLSTGLNSGDLKTYSSPGEPLVPGAIMSRVFDAGLLNFSTDVDVIINEGESTERRMFGVNLGEISVSDGSSTINVYVDNLVGNLSGNRAWFDGVGYSPATQSSLALDGITSFTFLGDETWELNLKGRANTDYLFRSSTTLDFTSGILLENLTQGTLEDPGTVGGSNDSVITTDSSGNATVQFTLSGNPTDFVRAETTE